MIKQARSWRNLIIYWGGQAVDLSVRAWRRIQNWRTPSTDRWIATLVVATSLLFIGALIFQQWNEVASQLREIHVGLLAAAFGATGVALILGGLLWHFVQKALGVGLGWQMSLAIHFSSGITKYLPGYGWQYMAKAYLSQRSGVRGRQVGAAMLTEFGLLILIGLALASLTASYLGAEWDVIRPIPAWVWQGGVVLATAIIVGGAISLPRLSGFPDRHVSRLNLLFAAGMGSIGWFVQCGAVWLVIRSLYPISIDALPQVFFALVFSGVVSILVVVVPGGIGVREMTLTLLLRGVAPLAVGGIVAVLVRVALILAELMLFGLIMLGQKWGMGRWPSPVQNSGRTDRIE